MQEAVQIKLPLFEGPLDLLLHLIKENKIDIYDIPISLITRQYLDYIALMKDLNLEIAGDFLVMAATLIHIKSRMMLPIEETADVEELEDPRLELVQRLLAYKGIKDAALGLKEREEEWTEVYYREAAAEDETESPEEELALFNLNIFDLLTAFRKILERAPEEALTITKEVLSIKDRIAHIIETISTKDAIRFEDLFRDSITKGQIIVTFIAMLEILKLGLAVVYQEREFGTIWVMRPTENPTEETATSAD